VEVSRILLDTSAYSAYTGGHPDLQEPVRHASTVHLSVVVVGELLAAFLKGGRRRQNERRLREFSAEPRVRVLHVDDETAVHFSVIRDHLRRQGTPVPTNDVWIAASAAQHGCVCSRWMLITSTSPR
jgi:tRNA(fMet)-specific endonuclease VapC